MKVIYVTWFYSGEHEGLYARFHDWTHAHRDAQRQLFDFDILPVTAENPDRLVALSKMKKHTDQPEVRSRSLPRRIRAIQRELSRIDPDVVHVLDFKLYAAVYPYVRGTTTVVGPNIGGWFPSREGQKWEGSSLERAENRLSFLVKRVLASRLPYERALAFTEYHAGLLSELGIPDSTLTVLPSGVPSMFSPGPVEQTDGNDLLYVGGLTDHKGYRILLRALAQVERDVTCRIVGPGDPDHALVSRLGLDSVVTHEGFVPREELPRYYRQADLLVNPTFDETGGTTTQVEALACGTPVVSTDAPGINELPSEAASRLFWPRTPTKLAAAIEEALIDVEELTAAAREGASQYDAFRIVKQLDETYRFLDG